MSAPMLGDLLAMVADLHTSGTVTARQAGEILAGLRNITPELAVETLMEFERQTADEAADDWRTPRRADDGTWC